MALISCPECGKEISNRAKCCIYCGFPLDELQNKSSQTAVVDSINRTSNICKIDGIEYDLTEVKNDLFSLPEGKLTNQTDKDKLHIILKKMVHSINGFSIFAAIMLASQIRETKTIPSTFNADQYAAKFKEDDGLVHCPRCNSTNVVTGQRGYSIIWGFAGSNRTMNRCAKCGHKWEPRG